MQITFSKNNNDLDKESIRLGSLSVVYSLKEKEYYFETSSFYLFLKTNYSERFIEEALKSIETLSVKQIQDLFSKDGFLVFIDKNSKKITVNRDLAGLCSGYYYLDKETFSISTNVHVLGEKYSSALDENVVHQLLYYDFIWDGQTIYKAVDQFKLGANFQVNDDLEVELNTFNQPNINSTANKMSDEENIKSLRQEIVEAHKPYVNDKNIVFLSGGIDSVAMLIALTDIASKTSIENHSFKVKGTSQDETGYAKSIADHLDTELKIIERDFRGEITEELFIDKILKMNNPYSGMWIFGNQVKSDKNSAYFAGQDTRLHTPALNKLDKIAFSVFELGNKGFKPLFTLIHFLLSPLRFIFNVILSHKTIHNKVFLGLRRALKIFNTTAYLNLVYFKVDKQNLASYKLPLSYFNTIKKNYNLNITKAKDKRSLYNVLVSKKWTEQYVNDMRYMVDMVDLQGGRLAMPFYDMDLAKFSATIPFDLANKTMKGKSQFDDSESSIVNKYVLREALADKIDKKTYLRSKAVSRTGHLIFTKGLDEVLKGIIIKDLALPNSFIKTYQLEAFLERFLNKTKEWVMTDDKYLLKVYYATCLIVYNQKIKKAC